MEAHSAPIAGSRGRSRELSENPRAAAINMSPRLWPARPARRAATIQQPLPCSDVALHLAPISPILQLFVRHCFGRAHCRSERVNKMWEFPRVRLEVARSVPLPQRAVCLVVPMSCAATRSSPYGRTHDSTVLDSA